MTDLLNPEFDDQKLLAQVVDYYHRTLKGSQEAIDFLRQRGLTNPWGNSATLSDIEPKDTDYSSGVGGDFGEQPSPTWGRMWDEFLGIPGEFGGLVSQRWSDTQQAAGQAYGYMQQSAVGQWGLKIGELVMVGPNAMAQLVTGDTTGAEKILGSASNIVQGNLNPDFVTGVEQLPTVGKAQVNAAAQVRMQVAATGLLGPTEMVPSLMAQTMGANRNDDLLGIVNAENRQRGYSEYYSSAVTQDKAFVNALGATGVSLVTLGTKELKDDSILAVTAEDRANGYGAFYMGFRIGTEVAAQIGLMVLTMGGSSEYAGLRLAALVRGATWRCKAPQSPARVRPRSAWLSVT